MIEKGQCFPLNLYEKLDDGDLYKNNQNGSNLSQNDGLTDDGQISFQSKYPDEHITKEDIFYYIYGILHSEDYRARFADNLSKQLPRIPAVKTADDFWAFVNAGRELGALHVDYESAELYPVEYEQGGLFMDDLNAEDYRVTKMKFAGKRPNLDKTSVIYNNKITMTGIPLEAYDYIVNGKSALDWVMERQVVKTDKASGIVNDANLYATETVGDPAYPLKLFQRVITVSLRTMEIVRSLPPLGDLS